MNYLPACPPDLVATECSVCDELLTADQAVYADYDERGGRADHAGCYLRRFNHGERRAAETWLLAANHARHMGQPEMAAYYIEEAKTVTMRIKSKPWQPSGARIEAVL